MHRLDQQCGVCNAWRWCGRQCKNAPKEDSGQIDRDPWDDPVERIEPKTEKAPVKKKPVKEPVMAEKKKKAKRAPPNAIRFPKEVLEYFRHGEPGWQTRINDALLKIAREG